MFRFTIFLSILLPWSGFLTGQEKNAPVKGPVPSIEELIKRLDSDDFKVRDAASAELLKRDGIRPVLRKALRDKQPTETTRRMTQILKELGGRAATLALKRLPDRIKNGQVDEVVEHFLRYPNSVEESHWDGLLDLARKMTAEVQKLRRNNAVFIRDLEKMKAKDFEKILKWQNKPWEIDEKRFSFCGAIIVGEGLVKPKQESFAGNLVLVNGDFHKSVDRCIIICDGHVNTGGSNRIVIAQGSTNANNSPSCFVAEGVSEALGLVKFYTISKAGIEEEKEDGKIMVKKIFGETPLARAGIQEGDYLLAFEDLPISDLDSLRRSLRRFTVCNDEVFLTVERKGKGKITLTMKFE